MAADKQFSQVQVLKLNTLFYLFCPPTTVSWKRIFWDSYWIHNILL